MAGGERAPAAFEPRPADERALAEIRAHFPVFEEKVRGKPLAYLDNAATTQKPREMVEALAAFYLKSSGNLPSP